MGTVNSEGCASSFVVVIPFIPSMPGMFGISPFWPSCVCACPVDLPEDSFFITGTKSIEQMGHFAFGSFDFTEGCIVQV
jgi:hypothetical protein